MNFRLFVLVYYLFKGLLDGMHGKIVRPYIITVSWGSHVVYLEHFYKNMIEQAKCRAFTEQSSWAKMSMSLLNVSL
jgi:hypothetical protein